MQTLLLEDENALLIEVVGAASVAPISEPLRRPGVEGAPPLRRCKLGGKLDDPIGVATGAVVIGLGTQQDELPQHAHLKLGISDRALLERLNASTQLCDRVGLGASVGEDGREYRAATRLILLEMQLYGLSECNVHGGVRRGYVAALTLGDRDVAAIA